MPQQVSRLIGLDDFEVRAVSGASEQLDLEVELLIRANSCPHCGRGSPEIKERPLVRFRDLPIGGRKADLLWRKRRYLCRGCERSFTEAHPELPSRQRVTRRFRSALRERASEGGAHTEIARTERTTRYQVRRAFEDGAERALRRRQMAKATRRLSLDEAHHRRGHELATVVSDLDRRCVIEVLDGRSQNTVKRYLRSLSTVRREAIEVVSIDPYEGYRQAVRAILPEASIVADRFHLVRGANEAMDTVRRQNQRAAAKKKPKGTRLNGRLATWRPELYRARHRLLTSSKRLRERDRVLLSKLFSKDPLIAEAWGLKEAFSRIYEAPDRAEAELRLDLFLAAVDRSGLKPFEAFAKGVKAWRRELLAYFDEPTTNGYAEGIINKVKVIKRRAYGLPTFAGFRERVLLACG